MKLHLVGLPHTMTTREASVCAFTQKIVKFGKMMVPRGWELVLYSGEENETPCAEHVALFTREEQKEWYGDFDANKLPSIATWNEDDKHWRLMNMRAIAEIGKRYEPGDLILLTAGRAQRVIAKAFPTAISCEWAAGYEGIFSPFVCFESYAWQSYLYGKINADTGRWFDAVIPNFFDLDEWPVTEEIPGDYLLFVGRLISNKGLDVAADIAAGVGKKLVIAGSGMTEYKNNGTLGASYLKCEDGTEITGNIEYVGTVGGDERTKLMAGADALIAATKYIEPFGAVAVEAQLCGTPVLTTDWGAFPETVLHGFGGYRFRTLKEGIEFANSVDKLDRSKIAHLARSTYSLESIAPLYENWFERLGSLWGDGWYAK